MKFGKINFRVWLTYKSQTLFVLIKILLCKNLVEFVIKSIVYVFTNYIIMIKLN